MNHEKEPGGELRENLERQPELAVQQSGELANEPTKSDIRKTISGMPISPGKEESLPQAITLEALTLLIGREVAIRDPYAKAEGRLDDPLFKKAVVERTSSGLLSVVIDRGRYYPLYTGDRRTSFAIDSQKDIDSLQIHLSGN